MAAPTASSRPATPRRRRRAPVAMVAVLAALGVSCSAVRPHAADIDGGRIDRADFVDELRTVVEIPGLADQLPGADGADGVDSTFAAQWLDFAISRRLVSDEHRARDLPLTTDHRDAAEGAIEQIFGPELSAGLPDDLRARLVVDFARQTALGEELLADSTDPDRVDAFLTWACPSGRSVAHILVDDDETAAAVLDRLDAGEGFAEVARDTSADPGSAAAGGALGCLQSGAFVAEFEQAAFAAAPGAVTDPVRTDFGVHLLLVETVTADVADALRPGDQFGALQLWLQSRLATAAVDVDPRFGTWVAGQGVRPPAAPDVRSGRDSRTEVELPIAPPLPPG